MASSKINLRPEYGGKQSITFNLNGVAALNDAKIKAGDIIVLQKVKAEYGLGISLTCGNVINGTAYIYAIEFDGSPYSGTREINYIGYHTT